MSERATRGPRGLVSGVWAGHYEQHQRRYSQRMTLEFADGLVRGDGVDDIGPFTLEGEYRADGGAVRVGWIKTYEAAHSVLYLGALEGGEIQGRWRLPGGTGSFTLRPSRALGASDAPDETHEDKP